MKNILLLFSVLILPAILPAQTTKQIIPQLSKSTVKQVVAAMTVEQKAKLVTGMGMVMPGPTANNDKKNKRPDSALAALNSMLPPTDADDKNIPEKVPGAAGRTHGFKQFGIPITTVSDGPAGVRISPIRNNDATKTYYATAWPVGTLLASSWDTALVKKVGVAFGNEVKEYGIDVLLGPALNIHRNPLGGRNFEYYSEDPVIAGNITAAIVNGIESNGVGTSIKHFAANNQETNRNSINTIVSERALREIYLKGFEIAVKKSQPWTVMSSYNYINGIFTSESHDLLTNILRKEWGFKGMVMTDWFGGKDPIAQMKAGNDLLMPGTPMQTKAIVDAVKNGTLDEKILNENAERILNYIAETPSFKRYKNSDKPDLIQHAKLSRAAASEGMVLLKNNNNALPLTSAKTVAVFGNTSYDIIAGGSGSGDVNKAYTVSLLQGLSNAGYTPEKELKNMYENYIADAKAKRPKPKFFFELVKPVAEQEFTAELLNKEATASDAAIITIGRNAGEGADREVENDFTLTAVEKDLIKNVSDAFHSKNKKVIVVLNIGGVIETASWRDFPDAILLAWQSGMEAGNAITDVLSGKVNPSGKLATTFPVNYSDVPSAKNFPGRELNPDPKRKPNFFAGVPAEVIYEEGIYVGYRYYNTFNVKPAYEFGYGLSYTDFKFGNLKLSSTDFKNKITATITVTNSGKVAGKEVAELYISAPGKSLDKPVDELKSFAKTNLLKPGESQTITFTINAADLASYDTKAAAWITEVGKYIIKIGVSSLDIKQTASFNVAKEIVVQKVTNQLVPKVQINELKR
ncbi:MAG TPA: glycoside hydrolase family 3 C-terminal domain-containing protein [Chitinophagaceae bacterium]|nr:glycoside hydrolase family 3 C-terminal domain-containing protein [Chitinophagaceae bacterium]